MLSCVSHSLTEEARVMSLGREGGVEGGRRWWLLQRQRKTGSASEFELKETQLTSAMEVVSVLDDKINIDNHVKSLILTSKGVKLKRFC